MRPATDEILSEVSAYYSGKLEKYGANARGVDWRDEESQHRRFSQLIRLLDTSGAISIGEIGCGYGALVDHLKQRGLDFSYVGCDVSAKMVEAAALRYSGEQGVTFVSGRDLPHQVDYVVASGIFNVRFDHSEEDWGEYVHDTIDKMAGKALRGFSFNALTGHADPDRMEARLWYPDPGDMLNYCLRRYGRNVALLHDYAMYEFTVFVRTNPL
jgi:SAM-dependent methyltransferase